MLRVTIITSLLAASLSVSLLTSAQAGGSSERSGFILFDLFSTAPESIYRRPAKRTKGPKVKGFSQRVGGYSYRAQDVWSTRTSKPSDFNPIFDRDTFSGRLGIDGPYIGE